MKNLAMALGLAVSLITAAPSLAEDGFADAPLEIPGAVTVNADELIELITDQMELIVLDSRKHSDFVAGHIEGAVNLVNTETTPESLAALIPSFETPIAFYCNGVRCGRAASAVIVAVEAGYTDVHYYALGMREWYDRRLPVETD